MVAPGNHFKALVGPVVKHQRAGTDWSHVRPPLSCGEPVRGPTCTRSIFLSPRVEVRFGR